MWPSKLLSLNTKVKELSPKMQEGLVTLSHSSLICSKVNRKRVCCKEFLGMFPLHLVGNTPSFLPWRNVAHEPCLIFRQRDSPIN